VESWARFHGTTLPPLLHVLPEPVNLFDSADTAVFLNDISLDMPEPPILTVIDTVARCMTGGDEDRARDMAIVFDNLGRVQCATGTAALLVAHTGHAEKGRERGSSAIPGAADMRIGVARPEKQNRVTVTAEKAKDAIEADPITLRLDPIPDTRSLAVTELIHGSAAAPISPKNAELATLILKRVA
jgi:hypothetical protein